MNSDNLIGNHVKRQGDVIEKIGAGGMATVYKAKDTFLNRFRNKNSEGSRLKMNSRLLRTSSWEAQSSASLAHNNIVSVYDVGEDNGIMLYGYGACGRHYP